MITTATTEELPLRILGLEVQNVKRLKAINIAPSGDVVIIGGRNGQGKSSILDSITMAMGGKEAICAKPVRDGESRASTTIDLGELVVTRTYTEAGGGTLTVKNRDGAKFSSPQAILDKLTGALTFDPLEFSRLKPAKQLETLRELVGVKTDLLDQQRQAKYDERTTTNRELASAKATLAGLADAIAGQTEPEGEPDISKLTQELEEARAHNVANSTTRARLLKAEEVAEKAHNALQDQRIEVERLKKLLADAEAKLPKLQETYEQATGSLERGQGVVAALKDRDEDAIVERMRTFNEVSALAGQFAAHRETQAKVEALEAQAAEQTKRIETLDERKRDRIANAKYPIEGMTLGDDGILLGGVPFEQASQAERIRVSVAMGIALNPRLKVLLIRDGSLLDEESMASIAEMAAEAGAQIWIERVGNGAECSVVIEDGEILEGGAE
jgi:hypothetical protein